VSWFLKTFGSSNLTVLILKFFEQRNQLKMAQIALICAYKVAPVQMVGEHVEMCVSIQFYVQGSGTLDSISVNFYFGQDRIVLYLIRSMVYNSIIKYILLLHQISILYCG
jgi:hypothetical protein